MAKKTKKPAPKAKRTAKAKSAFLGTDQYTPTVVALTWAFVLLAFVFVSVAYWRYG